MTARPLDPLHGVVGAVLTPFAADGRVDDAALARQIDLLAGHCDALSVLGAEASEYRALAPADRRATLRRAIELVDGRLPVLAGVTATSPAETAELAELAADAGARYAQALVPRRVWGAEPDGEELARWATATVAASPLPVVLYHNPGHGSDPSLEALVAACAVDGVAAIKDSSRHVARILRAIEEIEHAGHARYLGTIQPLVTVLLSGGAGAMTPPPATLVAAAIRDAVAAGDLGRAGALQRLVAQVPGRWTARFGLGPVMKVAADHLGLPLGAPAFPTAPVPEPEAAAIRAALAGWPRLDDPPAPADLPTTAAASAA